MGFRWKVGSSAHLFQSQTTMASSPEKPLQLLPPAHTCPGPSSSSNGHRLDPFATVPTHRQSLLKSLSDGWWPFTALILINKFDPKGQNKDQWGCVSSQTFPFCSSDCLAPRGDLPWLAFHKPAAFLRASLQHMAWIQLKRAPTWPAAK